MQASDPFLPLQLDADFRLNTDTGATSHMTPHRHWLPNYKPLRVPVKLANGSLVYSEGVGSLVFRPVVDGVQKRSIEFTRVLHVPLLRSNLLSILYLARVHHWHCHIDSTALRFKKGSSDTHFMATIDENNAAFLDGHVEEATEHSAQLSIRLGSKQRRRDTVAKCNVAVRQRARQCTEYCRPMSKTSLKDRRYSKHTCRPMSKTSKVKGLVYKRFI